MKITPTGVRALIYNSNLGRALQNEVQKGIYYNGTTITQQKTRQSN